MKSGVMNEYIVRVMNIIVHSSAIFDANFILSGHVHRRRCEILPGRTCAGSQPPAQAGNLLSRPQARKVSKSISSI